MSDMEQKEKMFILICQWIFALTKESYYSTFIVKLPTSKITDLKIHTSLR